MAQEVTMGTRGGGKDCKYVEQEPKLERGVSDKHGYGERTRPRQPKSRERYYV